MEPVDDGQGRYNYYPNNFLACRICVVRRIDQQAGLFGGLKQHFGRANRSGDAPAWRASISNLHVDLESALFGAS
jgi:hypothetical protein